MSFQIWVRNLLYIGHPITESFQRRQKCLKWISLCSRSLGYLRGTLVVSKILGSPFESSESFSYPDWSGRKFEDTEKTYFHQKILGDVFHYTCAYWNFAKILGNINVYPNIINVKPIHPKTLGVYIIPQDRVLSRAPKSDR